MMLSRIRNEQANKDDQDTGDGAQEELSDGASYTHPKGRAVDSSSVFVRSASMVATGTSPYERKSTESSFNRYYRYISALINSQYRKKNVDASSHVLETYHDSFLFGKVPASVKIRAALRGGLIGHIWHFLEFFLAITSGVLYVYSTYNEYTKGDWVNLAQNWISVAFLVDYVLRVYSESVRLYYIFSFWGLIDLLSALPIVYFFRNSQTLSFLRLLQFLRIIRVISLMSKLGIVGSTVLQQILLLVTSTFGAVFLTAGIFQYVEYSAAPASKKSQCPLQGCINFWDAFYFVIVTISTVGYGDITPSTQLGQLVAICTIIAALTILPVQIGKISYLASRRPYGGTFNGRKIIQSRYLILSGNISFQDLQSYLAEFFNPTHCEDLEIYPLRVTILGPYRPSFELKQLLSLYNGLVEFIEGSPIKQSDLDRICAKRATAFFLLADKEASDRDVEDAAQIVKALAVHRFCDKEVRVIVEVLEPLTQSSAVWDQTDNRVEVICPIRYHYKMIARSCFVKGLYTFITNLFTSEIKIKEVNPNSFASEYFHSFDNEVYPLIFPKPCYGMLFEEVVEFIFENYNVVLFALDVNVIDPERQERSRKVFLHPKGHIIDADDIGLVICWDLRTAYAISKFGDQDIEKKKWKKTKRLSTMELQKYRTGPIVDTHVTEHHPIAEHISYTAVNAESIESQLKSEICSRLSKGSRHGIEESRHGGKQGSTHGAQGSRHGADGSRHGAEGSKHGSEDAIESGYGRELSNGNDPGPFSSDDSDNDEGIYPRGMSLEKATELLLAWPPLRPAHVQPHPAVLERRQDVILQNLKERTIPVVALNVPHILVCCQSNWPQHIFYFVKELRRPDYPNPPIVILHRNEPTAYEWGKVGIFENVFFLKGSPIYELDLMRGGVLQAEKVVILGFHDTPVDLAGTGVEDVSKPQRRIPSAQRSDVDNIVICANVERLVGIEAEIVIVDMQHTLAFYNLRPKFEIQKQNVKKTDNRRNPDGLVHFGPPFMEGKAVSPALLGFLLRSSFYNRNTTSIVDQFLEGGHTIQNGTLSYNNPRILELIPIPKEYINKQYSDLFIGLLRDKGVLALGLYRGRGTMGAPTPYVYTNPFKETTVSEADFVYVIS
ncbi:hypothetical protein M758_5G140500 [Ceratodon purpureus]|nr:hypothetical protein M758_5G140500 [Ceratodon purpureus]KAG0616763.1 hypothetical protein M758_5G140500 [Ceratodon purpureus]KAG0616764.1 hypothetical protein M758_5G140500 [Ceratodon purpureus]KAG0616765.1 hypothetical protein M758_5G140500 [Ceratodon purpureus]KAG0616766.1 hypothetical protein M758_5G140500 [Ceratodon purpureus]